ncbi:hypothetical protein [Pyrococcus sp. ST04]|uniref:hypothetical protein n=1 Tax=Pyrococcus sp. ST04 TaxID=1183377 RepID=UPI0002605ABC|nr:hypothetical protein [Pyrococcus sp. ST04]AFK22125.1 hypothetical protein Py04_0523 [Pyrococcus sp. ST04]
MIGLISTIIGGAILKVWATVLVPLMYLAGRKSKDFAYLTFFAFVLIAMNEITVKSLFSYDSIRVFLLLVLPSLIALSESVSLQEFKLRKVDLIPISLFVLGLLHEGFFYLGLFYLAFEAYEPRRLKLMRLPLLLAFIPVATVLVAKLFLKEMLAPEYEALIIGGSLLIVYLTMEVKA